MFCLVRWVTCFLWHTVCSVLLLLFLLGVDIRWDYLRISDGSNRTIGTYCGYQTGKRVSVGDSIAVLIFHTDGSVRYRGFDLSFSFSPRSRGE